MCHISPTKLVETAENKITEAVSVYSNSSDFYLQINDGYLCLVVEVIKQIDPPALQEIEGEFVDRGCGIDHEHLFFSERISTKALEIGKSQDPQKFKLTIQSDYADNIVNELEDSYLAGEKIVIQLETITEHYYVVTANNITLPQADSRLEYTYFVFSMPEEDVVLSITQKGVEIPPPPVETFDITLHGGDILSQIVLNDAQKETVLELLADKHDWIPEIPECVVSYWFTGVVKESIEDIISRYSEDNSNDNLPLRDMK